MMMMVNDDDNVNDDDGDNVEGWPPVGPLTIGGIQGMAESYPLQDIFFLSG